MGFLGSIFGQIDWSAPPWLLKLRALKARNAKAFWLLIILLLLFVFGAVFTCKYISGLPEPTRITVEVELPDPVPVYERDEGQTAPHPLRVTFSYALPEKRLEDENIEETMLAPPEVSHNFPSVAPIQDVGQIIDKGITLSPHTEGQWRWQDDRTLVFEPENEWPAGQEYEITLDPDYFSNQHDFVSEEISFVSPSLEVVSSELEFELEASENLKQVYAWIEFSHPIEADNLQDHLHIAYQDQPSNELSDDEYTLSFDESMQSIYLTVPLKALPQQSRILEIKLEEGLRSTLGGASTQQDIVETVVVPDKFSYLKVEQAAAQIVKNQEGEPQQFITLSFTDPIEQAEFVNKLQVYLLPNTYTDKNGYEQNKYWQGPREVNAGALKKLSPLDFSLMPNAHSASKNYQLQINVPPNRQVYLRMDEQFSSANGFVHRGFFDTILTAPEYPKEIAILGEGSILSQSSKQQLSYEVRGVDAVEVVVGKVQPDQLYNLITQSRGDISSPEFSSWQFNEQNIAEFSRQVYQLNSSAKQSPKEANYGSVDLAQYVEQGELGLFFVEVNGWDKKRNRGIYALGDKRLILVSDLGLIVKANQDGTQNVFVQSIESGKPVADAEVMLLGRNGIALFSEITNADGLAVLPSTKGLTREKQPSVYLVFYRNDVAFIPFDRYTRQINYSRFDVGGVYNYSDDKQQINAFLFNDRGIYRPGEQVNLAGVVKDKGFSNIQGIPLELVIRDPQYNIVETKRFTLPSLGLFEHEFYSSKTAPTGFYEATLFLMRERENGQAQRSRRIGSTSFEVEAFQPDTVSISASLESDNNLAWQHQNELNVQVSMQNLFGTPAQNRRVESSYALVPTEFRFREFPNFTFNQTRASIDAEDNIESVSAELGSLVTNENGSVNLDLDFSDYAKGAYRVNLYASGFEASGGRSVNTQLSFLYAPMQHILGVKNNGDLTFINKDSERSVEVIAINNALEKIALDDLRLTKYRLQSVSTLVKQYNGRYQYERIQKRDLIAKGAFALGENGETLDLDTTEPGDFIWEISDSSGEVLALVEYKVVGTSNNLALLDKNADLVLKLNKRDYKAGEEIELSLQAPYVGSGLITIESDQVHAYQWFTTTTTNSVQRIRVPENLEGNAYVNVTFVRELDSKQIYTSPLSYAVAPFSIDKSKRILNVELASDNIVAPGDNMQISVNLPKASKFIVFAVDMGILQVADYKTPRPLAHFLQKRALSVRTMQMLDLILPDYAQQLKLHNNLSAAGGDLNARAELIAVTGARLMESDIAEGDPFARQIEDAVVYWSGIQNGVAGNNTVQYEVPNTFAGGLKIMAVAVDERAVGSASTETLVRGPFVLTPNVLTHAAPNDIFSVSLGIANLIEDSGDDAKVNVRVSTSDNLSLVNNDAANQTLEVGEYSEGSITVDIKASDDLGEASISFDVWLTDASGKVHKSTRSASLSLRPANPFAISVQTAAVDDSELSFDIPRQVAAQNATQYFTASSNPLVLVDGLSTYLDSFPHGCTEQIVSQVFPLIGLANLPFYQGNKDTLAHFNELLGKLRQRQLYNGGFSYWPSTEQADPYVSVYVLHFLLEAQLLDYPVPSDMLESGLSYLQDLYFERAGNRQGKLSLLVLRNQAHAIYLLTKSGTVTSNMIIDWVEAAKRSVGEDDWQSDIAAAYIAASYALLQQQEQAESLIEQFEWVQTDDDQSQVNDFNSALAINAQYLYLFAKHFNDINEDIGEQALLEISKPIYQGDFNTHSAAYAILALGAYQQNMQGNTELLSKLDASLTFSAFNNEQSIGFVNQTSASAMSFPFVEYNTNTTRIDVSGDSDIDNLFYMNVQAGYNRDLPTKPLVQGLEIDKAYLNQDGERVTEARQGETLTVKVSLRTTDLDRVDNLAIVDMLPAGFTVVRDSVDRRSGYSQNYVDIREDRITFYRSATKRISEFSYKVKVTSAGEFTLPPIQVKSMYDRSLIGRSAAGKMQVAKMQKDAQSTNDE